MCFFEKFFNLDKKKKNDKISIDNRDKLQKKFSLVAQW